MFGQKKADSIHISHPKAKTARGYNIRKMPIGAYLTAMDGLQEFPAKAMEAVFPDMSAQDILNALQNCNADTVGQMLFRALTVVPDEAITLIARLTGIDPLDLKEDENIGLDGLVEIIEAWIEVNNLENFMNAARGLMAKVKSAANGSKT